jgi:phosphohistidine phosphatase
LTELILVRHAIAEDRDAAASAGRDDTLRGLTKRGRARMERGAKGLRYLVPSLDVLASSPLRRATETAAIVSAEYDGIAVTTVLAFAPDAPLGEALEWLRRLRSAATVAAVGHEPHLGAFATWLLTGIEESRTPLGKGGACAIEFDGRVRAGAGRLNWLAPPGVLRRLGGH